MNLPPIRRAGLLLLACCACGATQPAGPPAEITYVGSSTIAIFVREAEPAYGGASFTIDTAPESEGGERAIVAGETNLAGVANRPRVETLRAGIASAMIGRDAIAVIVNARNPVANLSLGALRRVFTGRVRSWAELGGPDLPVAPLITAPGSATRSVFRDSVLQGADYAGCRDVDPDRAMIAEVAATPGGIGQISFSFLAGAQGVSAVSVDGEAADVTNFGYPIARPLHLLWREDDADVRAFVDWTLTAVGQQVVMRNFVGIRVIGSVDEAPAAAQGSLTVYTETYPVYDGGIYYYPHRPYELLTRYGELIRRVANHRGENDENPTRIRLAPGTYLVRAENAQGKRDEYFVTVRAGRHTRLDMRARREQRK